MCSYHKNKSKVQTVKNVKNITGFDGDAEYNLVYTNPDSQEFAIFVGSKSDMSKRDTAADSLMYGYGGAG